MDLDFLLPDPDGDRADSWRWATVTQASPLRVRLDGDTTALPVTPDALVGGASVGRRVWVQIAGRRVIIHGVAGGPEPVGTITQHAGSLVPGTWAACDGSAVPRTGQYAALFSVIGTTYGAGDGSTTFNLPDLRGKGPQIVRTFTGTTDADGYLTVTHGLGFTPVNVAAIIANNVTAGPDVPFFALTDSIGATTFRMRVLGNRNSVANASYASLPVSGVWVARGPVSADTISHIIKL